MTELERCVDFIVRLADRAAKTKVPSRYGVAHLNTDLPRVWSRNYLFADGDLGDRHRRGARRRSRPHPRRGAA